MLEATPQHSAIANARALSNYDEEDVTVRVFFADVIEQANTAEFIINDYLAFHDLCQGDNNPSKAEYLGYVGDRLQKAHLRKKCDRLLEVPEARISISKAGLDIEVAKDCFDSWCEIRNRFAHGMLVGSSNGTPVLYHNGYCYSIPEAAKDFFFLNAHVIDVLRALRPMASPYNGCPVLRDDDNSPDNPYESNPSIRY